MEICLLETTNKDGEVLRLQKEMDEEKYSIMRGQYLKWYAGQGGQYHGTQGRFELKGTYTDLANALGVYCQVLKGLVCV